MRSNTRTRLVVGLFVVLWLVIPMGTRAAPPDQQPHEQLEILVPVDGAINEVKPEALFDMMLFQNQVFSLVTWNRSGDLIIDITVTDPSGQIVPGASVNGTGPDATIIDAVVAPQTGTYTVSLRRSGSTGGEYGLLLLPGYSFLDKFDDFEQNDEFTMIWEPFQTENVKAGPENGEMRMQILSPDIVGYITPDNTEGVIWDDVYIEADVRIEGSPSYYEYGFLLRVHPEREEFYAITFSSENDWTVMRYDGQSWSEIMPWTVSDVIDLGDPTPRIGVMVQGYTFRAYFNDRFVGEVTDTNQFASQGTIALAAATVKDQVGTLTVIFDNVVITSPFGPVDTTTEGGTDVKPTPSGTGLDGILSTATLESGSVPTPDPGIPFNPNTPAPGATHTPPPASPTPGFVMPTNPPLPTAGPTSTPETVASDALLNWASSDPAVIITELQQRGVIPAGGVMAMTVPNSFGDTSSSGFNYYQLAQGRTFRNVVLGFDAHLDITGAGSGCGMHFRNTGASTTYGLVMEDGSALLAQFNNNEFHPSSFFDISPAVVPGQGAINRVTIVAYEQNVRMYVNGQLVAQAADFEVFSGGVALSMYVNENSAGRTQRTYCQLDNIWLWEF